MTIWKRRLVAAALFSVSFMPFAVNATKVRMVSGLVGAQDSTSMELLALSPTAASQVATRDLLSVLKPTGRFTTDNSRNVEGATFITQPYQTMYRYLCREDRVTRRYTLTSRFKTDGAWLDYAQQPAGVEAQPLYHIEQLPVPGFIPGHYLPRAKRRGWLNADS